MPIVDLTTLDKTILDKIPLSIRLSTKEIELEELPLPVQYIVQEHVSIATSSIYTPDDFYDVEPKVSPYNDFVSILTKREAIKEYLENYFNIRKGAYPFDPEFGNTLHTHLQTKDTSLRETLISSELSNITRLISQSFDEHVSVTSAAAYPKDIGGGIEYYLDVEIKIDDEIVNLNLNK
jgi:hypothetical protein